MNKFKIAMVQHSVNSDNKDLNTELAINYICEAKKNKADLVLFPECFITSYKFPEICEKLLPVKEIENMKEFRIWNENALCDDDIHLKKIQETALKYNIGVCITSFTKGKKYPKNTAFVIDRKGKILLKYSKVHTCDFSLERYIESGDGFYVCDFEGIKIGVMICYDREYPESARELMLQGAELILVPNCCGNMKMRLRELSVRAMENLCVVAMANPPGEDMGNSAMFHPMVWDYDDNLIVKADDKYEGIVYGEFDTDEVRRYCSEEDIGKFRKKSAYKNIMKKI